MGVTLTNHPLTFNITTDANFTQARSHFVTLPFPVGFVNAFLIIGWNTPLVCFSRQLYNCMKEGKTASKSWIVKSCFVQQVHLVQIIGIVALLFKLICSAFTTELTHFSHWELPESAQTFPTVRKYVSMTCFAPRRCFQFGSRCRARSRKCTLVLLLPGHRSQNTSYSRANVVTGV